MDGIDMQPWAEKRVELKPIGWLKPFERNPREITEDDVRKLAHVIETQGFLDPIEARETGEILSGHRRLLAAKHLKLQRVPVIVHGGMSDEEAQAYRIGANRLSEDVRWNRALLSDALASMTAFSPADLGFEDADVAKLFDLDRGADEAADGETITPEPEMPGPFVRQGESWMIGPVEIVVWSDRPDSLRKVEGLIIKMEKWLKTKATLGKDGPTFAAVISDRAASAGSDL